MPKQQKPQPHVLEGFVWESKLVASIPTINQYCVRLALTRLMRWRLNSAAAQSIPPGVLLPSLPRLCTERPGLGLKWHGQGDPDVPGEDEGIIVGELPIKKGVLHAEYGKKIAYARPLFTSVYGVITRI
jgi:hypothetical protein